MRLVFRPPFFSPWHTRCFTHKCIKYLINMRVKCSFGWMKASISKPTVVLQHRGYGSYLSHRMKFVCHLISENLHRIHRQPIMNANYCSDYTDTETQGGKIIRIGRKSNQIRNTKSKLPFCSLPLKGAEMNNSERTRCRFKRDGTKISFLNLKHS